MSERKPHDLHDFIRQVSLEMSAEYDRIQRRATEDPGTAGDQGEENWATLLRDWLPRNYEVVTKGRIISQDSRMSPQIDVLVLSGAYPKKLLDKKVYLAAGVAAAFECKITLRASHIAEAMETCAKIKGLYPPRFGSPYKELHSPIVYGVLCHSHSWKGQKSTPEQNIEEAVREGDALHALHPRQQLDLLCVADLAAWTAFKIAFIGPRQVPQTHLLTFGSDGAATTVFMRHKAGADGFTPIGVVISHLSRNLAWENPSLRALADYYRLAEVSGPGRGQMRTWPGSIYSDGIRPRVEAGHLSNGVMWDEWSLKFA